MPATIANYDAALKETWTESDLHAQFYDENPFLDRIEKTDRYNVGQQAVTPIKTNRNGGYSVAPAAGSSALNAAGNVGSNQATWQYTHHWQQIAIESAAIEGTNNTDLSVANVIDEEVQGALSEIRKQITRQAFSNGDALIAQCTSGGASTTVNLLTTGYGPDALVRGWLHPGQTVDVGTTASEASLVADSVISSVDLTNSTITIGSSITTTSSHYVSIANARSGATSYEMNGLRNIAGSSSATLGGINPSSEPIWTPASVDSSTTDLTLDALYPVQRAIVQKTGSGPDYGLLSLKQREKFYKLLQMQVRFQGDGGLGAGNMDTLQFAGMTWQAHPDVPDRNIYLLTLKELFMVESSKPRWQSDTTGGKILAWKQGSTQYVAAMHYHANLATRRRNAHGAFTALTAA